MARAAVFARDVAVADEFDVAVGAADAVEQGSFSVTVVGGLAGVLEGLFDLGLVVSYTESA